MFIVITLKQNCKAIGFRKILQQMVNNRETWMIQIQRRFK